MPYASFDCWPRRVVSGAGSIKSVGEIIKSMGKQRVMVFTDTVMKDFPLIKDLVAQLEGEGLEVSMFSNIGPNPVAAMVDEAVKCMNEAKPNR